MDNDNDDKIQPGPNGGVSVPVGVDVSSAEMAPHADKDGNVFVSELRLPDGSTIKAGAENVTTQKTAEQWATELGHLPEFVTPTAPKGAPKKAMRAVYNPKAQLFLSTKAHHSWPVGKELTKADYLAAVEAATTHVFR